MHAIRDVKDSAGKPLCDSAGGRVSTVFWCSGGRSTVIVVMCMDANRTVSAPFHLLV